jgi:serine/threonine protein kinase
MADLQERIGQQIGDYRLLRQLGKGSFGTVYLAEHFYDNTPAAVKLLQFPLTSPKHLRDFLNEARTIRLQHPHIVPLLDFGLSRDDLPYLVMEYAAGGTLHERYPRGSKVPWETIDSYVRDLASALQYAHDRRIIHRDIKPENLLLRQDGTILLSDFGIAKIIEQATLSSLHQGAGTPAYSASEQSQGHPCPASDQYALAVVVYEWLSGQLPFRGKPLEVLFQHYINPPPSLHTICPQVSVQMEQVIFTALAKDPAKRFPTITHFAQGLHTTFQEQIARQRSSLHSGTASIPTMPFQPSVVPSQIQNVQFVLTPTSKPTQQKKTQERAILKESEIQTIAPTPLPTRFLNAHRFFLMLLSLILFIVAGSGGTWFYVAHQNQLRTHATATPTKSTVTEAQATATAVANVVFFDPLSQEIHNFPVSSTGPKQYVFKDGAYHITNAGDNAVAVAVQDVFPETKLNYQLTMAEINGDDTSPVNTFGMILRYNEQVNQGHQAATFYSFEIRNQIGSSQYEFYEYDNNKSSPWIELWHADTGREFHGGQGLTAVNMIRVFANGSTFTFYVNGQKVGSFKDDSLPFGSIGMLVNLKGTEVAFSNMLMTLS